MRRVADGIVLGFSTSCAVTVAAVVAAFFLHRVEIPLLLTVRAALPQGLPEVELIGDPFGFVAILVLVATTYALVARRCSSPESGAPVSLHGDCRATRHWIS